MAKAVKKKNLVMRSTDPAPTKQTLPYDPSKGRKIEKLTTAKKAESAPTKKQIAGAVAKGAASGAKKAASIITGANAVKKVASSVKKPTGVTAGTVKVAPKAAPSGRRIAATSSGKMMKVKGVAIPRTAKAKATTAKKTAIKSAINKKLY